VLPGLALIAGAILSFHWMYEPDLGWHLAQGREIASGRLVRTNLFSATQPEYRQPFESWLFELGAYEVWKLGGASGIQVAQALTIAAALSVVYLACRQRAPKTVALAVATFGAFLLEPRSVPRPHIVSFVLGAGCALLLERTRVLRSVRPLLWAVPLIALWSNIHAESMFGAALIGMFAIGELIFPRVLSRKQAWAAAGLAALCMAANSANPFGTGLLSYLWENAMTPQFIPVAEFRPAYLPTYAPFFAYLAVGAALILWKRRTVAAYEMLIFCAFGALAVRHLRFVALFLCVTAPVVAAAIATLKTRRIPGFLQVAGALCLGLILTPVPMKTRIDFAGIGPSYLEPKTLEANGAATFIRSAGLTGPVFNSVNLGGYLEWNSYPSVRVFQDTRFQAYPPEHFRKIIAAYQSQAEWDSLLSGIDWAVLTLQRNTPLTGFGRFPAEQWAPVYHDDAIIIVVRRSGKFGMLATARPSSVTR
jgi:hypothetical protein